ncbi:hypothetical protein [Chryseobacterium sp.]|uniref:hypothetical protein n=1 Tax=Chryseobacterium sp. TaxID=1871047 RepID=UPI002898AE47|nr:hypothetical protein [Chryseobacterium sp.]
MEFKELSNKLQAFTIDAEEYAIKAIQENIKFSPYIFLGSRKMKKIIAENLDEVVEIATEEIEELEEETVVLIYHDKVKLNDGEFDGIISQIYDIDEDSAYSFGLLYKIESNTINFLNKRVFLGKVRNCLIF